MKDGDKPVYGGGWKRLARGTDYYKKLALELLLKLRQVRKQRSRRHIAPEEKEAFQYLEKRLKRTYRILSKLEKRYKKGFYNFES